MLELAVELRGERLVVRKDERGPVERRDDVGHGERLARAGDAEQRGMLLPGAQPLQQLLDRLRLIAERRVRAMELEGHPSNKAVILSLSKDLSLFCTQHRRKGLAGYQGTSRSVAAVCDRR